jgi:hypothetical protein
MPDRFGTIITGKGNSRRRLGRRASGTMGVDIQRFADLLVTRTELSQQAQHPL